MLVHGVHGPSYNVLITYIARTLHKAQRAYKPSFSTRSQLTLKLLPFHRWCLCWLFVFVWQFTGYVQRNPYLQIIHIGLVDVHTVHSAQCTLGAHGVAHAQMGNGHTNEWFRRAWDAQKEKDEEKNQSEVIRQCVLCVAGWPAGWRCAEVAGNLCNICHINRIDLSAEKRKSTEINCLHQIAKRKTKRG